MFNRIAPTYDVLNDVMTCGLHHHWKACVVQQTQVKAGDRVLDLCTGTGDIAYLLAQRVGVQGQVIGLDFSSHMLEIANQQLSLPQLSFVEADALQLPFENGQFHAVTIGYGLRNLAHIEQGLNEIRRVTKPGGRFVSLDLAMPLNPYFAPVFYFFFHRIVPLMGKMIHGNSTPYHYLPLSLQTFPAPAILADMIQLAGFSTVSYRYLAGETAVVHVAF